MKNETSYRGHIITPRKEQGGGFWVVKNNVNIMPGGCWFKTPKEAKHGIDVLIRVKGNAELFWEVMQPFEYTEIGQKTGLENSTVNCGRFKAVIENYIVVKLITKNRNGTVTTIEVDKEQA